MAQLKRETSYLPRRERVKTVEVPINTPSCLIVRPNKEGLGYRLDCYNEEILGGKVERDRFLDTVFNCSKICQNNWSRKKLLEEKDQMMPAKNQIIATCSLLVAGLICFSMASYSGQNDNINQLLGVVGFCFITFQALIAVIIVSFQILRSDVVTLDLENECKRQLDSFLNSENAYYISKGLRWNLGENFFWLELSVLL